MAAEAVTDPREHWLLAGLPAEVVQPLLDTGREERYLPGDIIFREGAPADGLYLSLVGTISITAQGPEGETLLALVKPNEVFGELGVLDGGPRAGTAQARTICAVYFLPAEPFLDLLEQSSLASMRLLAVVAQRLRGAGLVELRPASPASEPSSPLGL